MPADDTDRSSTKTYTSETGAAKYGVKLLIGNGFFPFALLSVGLMLRQDWYLERLTKPILVSWILSA